MAKTKTETPETGRTLSGLPETSEPRRHYDIYAILEAPQEVYFGDEKEVNINIVEKVRIMVAPETEVEKCYISPTKRRGIERRTLLWADAGGKLLMDRLECGIPNTCCDTACPICRVFGGLQAGTKTFIGRLSHGGGVAIGGQIALEKQRAMHPALVYKETGDNPMPYRKEYAQPGLLYPVSNHCISVTEGEFTAAAYAFLSSFSRLGAGNPKGVALARASWAEGMEDEPLLVVDEYRVPMAERPIVSPTVVDNAAAVSRFIRLAGTIHPEANGRFERRTGAAALQRLQTLAADFEAGHLQNGGVQS
ncbi:MAG: hypothetical protein ACLFRG_18375 [Desulfococcaceae bacterium]